MYDSQMKRMHYCGHHYMPITSTVQDLIPMLNERAGFAPDTELILFEEIKPNLVERISLNEPIGEVLAEILNGDIIVFQKNPSRDPSNSSDPQVTTCRHFFRDLFYRVEVTFCDKMIPDDPGFTMELSIRMTYDQLVNALSQRLCTDPSRLQLFRKEKFVDSPGNAIKHSYEGTLKHMLGHANPKDVKKLYYQQRTIPDHELENKMAFKCLWWGPNMRGEKEMVLYPNKNATVVELLEEAKKEVELSPDTGSGKLRLREINWNKMHPRLKEDALLKDLLSATNTTKLFAIEEIPKNEMELLEDDVPIPVAH